MYITKLNKKLIMKGGERSSKLTYQKTVLSLNPPSIKIVELSFQEDGDISSQVILEEQDPPFIIVSSPLNETRANSASETYDITKSKSNPCGDSFRCESPHTPLSSSKYDIKPQHNKLGSNPHKAGTWSNLQSGAGTLIRVASMERSPSNGTTSTLASGQENCFPSWPATLKDRPYIRLFLIIMFNGLVSLASAAIFEELEAEPQLKRFSVRENLNVTLSKLRNEVLVAVKVGCSAETQTCGAKLEELINRTAEFYGQKEEVKWNIWSASAYVSGVSTTTGYGDVIPKSIQGKIFTIVYAMYGIPMFIWYIVKLGAIFKYIVKRIIVQVCVKLNKSLREVQMETVRRSTQIMFSIAKIAGGDVLPYSQIKKEEHRKLGPLVMGILLTIWLVIVAAIISTVYNHTYFDSFYACFITYSTIGFGDIRIYHPSYENNWLHLLLYGNLVHVIGYMVLSAWISSILEMWNTAKW